MKSMLVIVMVAVLGCGDAAEDSGHDGGSHGHGEGDHSHGADSHSHGDDGRWSVTTWGDHFEIFVEADPLMKGQPSTFLTHVTALEGFEPLHGGTVEAVLKGRNGQDTTFSRVEAVADGIFNIEVKPGRSGEFQLLFRVQAGDITEHIPAGKVKVGEHLGGGLVKKEYFTDPGGEAVEFLKELQWQVPFSTAWVELGAVNRTVSGPGHIRPQAGGEVVVTATLDGLVTGDPWPHPGMPVRRGEAVFRLLPLVSQGQSLAELQAEVSQLEAALGPASDRLERLETLLEKEAVSKRDVETSRTEVKSLDARLEAARKDLATASSARQGTGSASQTLALVAPFSGTVSKVMVTRGQVVNSGDPLGRVVKPDPVWIEVSLGTREASLLRGNPSSIGISAGEALDVFLEGDAVRLVSRSPEVDPATGTVTALFEVADPENQLIIGTAVQVEIGLAATREGMIIPSSALVDDAGVSVVYLQASGEAFVRREVEVLARQGHRVAVSGLSPGLRVVSRGGASIRRATLISAGGDHGHVH